MKYDRTKRFALAFLFYLTACNSALCRPRGFFTDVKNLGPEVNGRFLDRNSSVSPDGLTLFFESNRPGGLGDDDIYMSQRKSTDEPFGPPIHLAEISSSSFDRAPRITPDGLTLYFLSRRPLNNTTNIWVATRPRTTDDVGNPEPFGEPEPVEELNSSSYEAGPYLSFGMLGILVLCSLRHRYYKQSRARVGRCHFMQLP